VDGLVGGGVSAGAARGNTVVELSEPNRSWRTHGSWVLARDGERRWPFVVVLGTKKLVTKKKTYCTGFEWSPKLEDGWRWKTTGTGRRPEMEDSRNWKNDGVGQNWRTTVAGRAWRTAVAGRAWWSTVGRKWVDGEREGAKNLGESSEMKKMAK
jgi:hypothetical protein